MAKNGRRRFGRHHWLHQPSHCAIRFGSMAQGPKRRLAKGVPRRRRGGLGWMFQVFKSQLGGFNTSMMPELSLNLFWQFDWIGLCMFMYVYVCLCMFMYVYVCLCMFMWRPHSSFQNWLNGQTGYGFFSSISWRIQPYFDAFPRTLHRKFGHCPAGFTTARLAPTCSNL